MRSPGNAPLVENVPDIVRVVLTQASRMRNRGAISDLVFNAQVDRLEREELVPRGYHLRIQELPGGTTRFAIEGKYGDICQLVEAGPRDMNLR